MFKGTKLSIEPFSIFGGGVRMDPQGGLNENCFSNNTCHGGLSCKITPGSDPKKCFIAEYGECSSSNDCISGNCFEGKCYNILLPIRAPVSVPNPQGFTNVDNKLKKIESFFNFGVRPSPQFGQSCKNAQIPCEGGPTQLTCIYKSTNNDAICLKSVGTSCSSNAECASNSCHGDGKSGFTCHAVTHTAASTVSDIQGESELSQSVGGFTNVNSKFNNNKESFTNYNQNNKFQKDIKSYNLQ